MGYVIRLDCGVNNIVLDIDTLGSRPSSMDYEDVEIISSLRGQVVQIGLLVFLLFLDHRLKFWQFSYFWVYLIDATLCI